MRRYSAALAIAAIGTALVAASVAAFLWVGSTSAPDAPIASPPLPLVTPTLAGNAPPTPYFDDSTPAISAPIFPERVADLVDLERQTERVEAIRFRLSSRALIPQLGSDTAVPPRESWAVPMGEIVRDGRRVLAVATTRCLVDYRYPDLRSRDGYRNLALITSEGRDPQVFRVGGPTVLPGVIGYDARREAFLFHGRSYLEGRYGDRFFGELEARSLRVDVALPVGSWEDNTGADMVVLYFPLDDPGTIALSPRRHLGVDDPEGSLRDILLPRTSLWGSTFTFSLVSSECMTALATRDTPGGGGSDSMFLALAAVVGVAVLGPIVIPALGEGLTGALVGRAGMSLSGLLGAAAPVVWRTITRVLAGEALTDVLWSEAGQLVLSYVRGGAVQRIVLAGISGLGLDDEAAARVAATVESFAISSSEATLAVLTRDGEAAERCNGTTDCAGAIVSSDDSRDIATELLRRGLARLDMTDLSLLAQQVTLVRAASDAIADPETRGGVVADPEYQRRVRDLAAGVGR